MKFFHKCRSLFATGGHSMEEPGCQVEMCPSCDASSNESMQNEKGRQRAGKRQEAPNKPD